MRFDAGFAKVPRVWWTFLEAAPTAWVKVWLYLALNANIRPGYFMGRMIQPGQVAFSLANLSKSCGVTLNQTRAALSHMEETGAALIETTRRYSVLTLVDSDAYANRRNSTPHTDHTPEHTQTTHQSTNQTTHRESQLTAITSVGCEQVLDSKPHTEPHAAAHENHTPEHNNLKSKEIRVEKEEEDAPPPPPSKPSSDNEPEVAALLHEIAAAWPGERRGNLRFAVLDWIRHARADTDGVAAWCNRIRSVGMGHARAYVGLIADGNGKDVPTLQNWITDGYYQLPAPQSRWTRMVASVGDGTEDAEARALISGTTSTPAPKPAPAPVKEETPVNCYRCSDLLEIARDGITFEELEAGTGMIPCPECTPSKVVSVETSPLYGAAADEFNRQAARILKHRNSPGDFHHISELLGRLG